MKAILLVGGFGTRLRPLTQNLPKPMVRLCNIPILEWQIISLVEAGVKEIILAINYKSEIIIEFKKQLEQKYNIIIHCSIETEPLGTGGPLKLAENIIRNNNTEEIFFVLNADIICDYPFKEMINKFKDLGDKAEGMILLTEVEDPSQFGVVKLDDNEEMILEFIEKPKEFISNKINAGIYILRTSILNKMKLEKFMIEHFFPQIAAEKLLYSHKLTGNWADLGKHKDYIEGHNHQLKRIYNNGDNNYNVKQNEYGYQLINNSNSIGENTLIKGNVVLGNNNIIGRNCVLENVVLFDNITIKDNCILENCVIDSKCKLGLQISITDYSIIAENCTINDYCDLKKVIVYPNIKLENKDYDFGTIIKDN